VGLVTGTYTPAANTLYFLPFYLQTGRGVQALAVQVFTAGSAGAVIRLGIYADANGVPGTLIRDAGTIDATTTGVKTLSFSPPAITTPGWIWLAAASQGGPTTPPLCIQNQGDPNTKIPLGAANLANGQGVVYIPGVSGALPGSAGTRTSFTPISQAAALGLQLS